MKHFEDYQNDELRHKEELAIFCAALGGLLSTIKVPYISNSDEEEIVHYARRMVRAAKVGGKNGFANLDREPTPHEREIAKDRK